MHNWFSDLRDQEIHERGIVVNDVKKPFPNLFNFTDEERGSTTTDVIKQLEPTWYT